jgi:ribose transport system permease protein
VFSAFALGLHLFTGRFDFSLGSVAVLAAVIGGKLALLWDLDAFGMLVLCLASGAALGAVSGLLYLLFNLPPMITSLGVALSYEGLSFAITGGNGVQISLYPKLLGGAGIPQMIALLATALLVMYVLLNCTQFGFNYRAIQFGQKIAVDTGLNEKANALACYILCGALVSVVGFLRISFNGSQAAQLNLATSSTIFSAMLPMFIGGLMAGFCEQNISMVVGCLTAAFITQGLSSVGVSAQARSLITSFLMILILMYSTNGAQLRAWLSKRFSQGSVPIG